MADKVAIYHASRHSKYLAIDQEQSFVSHSLHHELLTCRPNIWENKAGRSLQLNVASPHICYVIGTNTSVWQRYKAVLLQMQYYTLSRPPLLLSA